jgi:hypothetical protein
MTTETALPLRRADRELSPDDTPPRSPFTDEGVRPDTRGLLVKSESFLFHGSPRTPAAHVEEWLQAHEARCFRGNHVYTVATPHLVREGWAQAGSGPAASTGLSNLLCAERGSPNSYR